jgi:hypothetical protein
MVRYLDSFCFLARASLNSLLGGGYVMPLSKGHLDWMEHVRNEASTSGIELSVCLLEYGTFRRCRETKKRSADHPDLIPDNPYPRQMVQAIFALRHLLSMGYKPSEVRVCPQGKIIQVI